MPSYKLSYFNLRGRAELSRWIFAAAEQKYEDVRIEREQWAQMKKSLPFGVPYLEMDDFKLSQSNTIARFLARKLGLAGKTDLEEARADMVVDSVEEMLKPLFQLLFYTSEDQKKEVGTKWDEQKPTFLKNLENLLVSNNGGDGYFIGSDLTWADMAVVLGVAWIKDLDYGPYPKLGALKERVEANPGIAEWIGKRPVTDM